jgi:SPP1 gp7 family putative phage head morphogenesis protein
MDNNLIKALFLCFDKPPEDAIKYLESLGYKITWNWQEQLHAIKDNCFTVAKVTSADILQMFKEELTKNLEDGGVFEDFKKNISKLLEQKGYHTREDGSAWRLDTIYRTNIQGAFQAGRYLQQMEVADDRPYLEYVAVLDNRTRPSHSAMNGVVAKTGDPFWKTNYPLNGFSCRCRTRSVSPVQFEKRKLELTDPDVLKNLEPDPGFDTNPAMQFEPDYSKYSKDIKKKLIEVLS